MSVIDGNGNGNGKGQPATAGRERGILVVGGGMAGISAAIEASEAGSDVYIIEQGPSLGGRVAQMHQYFPKLCPPYCGLEINFRRIRSDHRHFKVFTLASLERVSGSVGDYEATIRLDPRYVVLDRCIACNRCAEVCPVEFVARASSVRCRGSSIPAKWSACLPRPRIARRAGSWRRSATSHCWSSSTVPA